MVAAGEEMTEVEGAEMVAERAEDLEGEMEDSEEVEAAAEDR